MSCDVVLGVIFPKLTSPGKLPEGFVAKGCEVSRAGVAFQKGSQ